jgi:ferredoxin--NADP+ reductase
VPTVTREPFAHTQRCSDLFISGQLAIDLNLPSIDAENDRVLICGNPEMNKQMSTYLKENGWIMTNHKGIGNFSVEAAFVIHHS